MKNNKLISSLVIGLGFPLTQFMLILYTPALSTMQNAFGVTTQQILFTLTISLIGYTLGNLFWGTLSDHIGRRNALLTGLSAFMVVSFLVPLSHAFIYFTIALALYGFLAATFTSIGNAMLKDIHGQDKVAHVISLVGIAMATTPVVAPVIGSHLLHYFGWHSIYIFLGVYALIMLAGVIAFVPQSAKQTHRPSLRDGLKSHLTNRKFLGYIVSLALLFGGIITTLEMLPIIYTHYLSLPLISFGYLSLLFMATYPIGSTISSRLVKRWNTRCVMRLGIIIAIAGAALLAILSILTIKNIALISFVIALVFLGFGLSLSMAKAGAMTSVKHHVGSASSLMKFIQSFGAMVITAINAHIHQNNSISHYAILLLVTLFSSYVVLYYAVKKNTGVNHGQKTKNHNYSESYS
jgi:DHA1 family bicyclomycin/chloramphenicol resistance-like MFS transporter